jgi:putative heme iron utilization protein
MGNKFKFIDSNSKKAKKTHFQHTEDDIVLTLPDESGTLVTTNTVDDILDVDKEGNSISCQQA